MTREEFVKQMLAGERDFSKIKLPEGTDLSGYERFKEMQDYLYLQTQELIETPIIISDSEFKYVTAEGLYLPYVIGERVVIPRANLWRASLWHADLSYVDLEDANLGHADLRDTNLMNTDFRGASLWHADLGHADLRYADLRYADLEDADLRYADLEDANLGHANLRGVKNLEKVTNLKCVNFTETRVSPKEKEIIEKALKKRRLFVVEE